MKKLIIILCTQLIFISCNKTSKIVDIRQEKTTKTEFHVKAKYWAECKWKATFTNDNFDTEEEFMVCFDISAKYSGNEIVHQLKIFNNENDAVSFAKKFESYDRCKHWNDSVSLMLLKLEEYRKNNPIKKEEYPQESSCKNEEGKEILVY